VPYGKRSPTKFELVINFKTTKQVGLTISIIYAVPADKVIKEAPILGLN
jgi:hypothetical protein